ncbi:hypothetical protein ACJX0J_039347, partial [Zea mays]
IGFNELEKIQIFDLTCENHHQIPSDYNITYTHSRTTNIREQMDFFHFNRAIVLFLVGFTLWRFSVGRTSILCCLGPICLITIAKKFYAGGSVFTCAFKYNKEHNSFKSIVDEYEHLMYLKSIVDEYEHLMYLSILFCFLFSAVEILCFCNHKLLCYFDQIRVVIIVLFDWHVNLTHTRGFILRWDWDARRSDFRGWYFCHMRKDSQDMFPAISLQHM